MNNLTLFLKNVFVLLLFFGNLTFTVAQSNSKKDDKSQINDTWSEKKNTVKIGFPVLAYERVLSENKSVNIHLFRRKFDTGTPSPVLNLEDVPFEDQAFASAFAVTAEYRFYKGKKQAPNGFYVGPFLRYSNFKWNITDNNLSDGFTENIPALGEFRMNNIGAGVQCGVQWTISNLISVDWSIIGLGAYRGKIKATVRSDRDVDWESAAKLYTVDFDDTDNEFLLNIGEKIKFEKDGDSMVSDLKVVLPTIRSTLTIGVRF